MADAALQAPPIEPAARSSRPNLDKASTRSRWSILSNGLPVSTTHVLVLSSSGVAGTMAANGSGLQMATVRNLLMAWVLTLPAAITLSATLYILFLNIF